MPGVQQNNTAVARHVVDTRICQRTWCEGPAWICRKLTLSMVSEELMVIPGTIVYVGHSPRSTAATSEGTGCDEEKDHLEMD